MDPGPCFVYVRFRAVVLIKKFVFNVVYEQIGVAGSHFGKMVANEKQFSVKTSSARRSSVSELGSLETCALYNSAYTWNSKFIRKPSLCSSSYSDVLVFV